MKRLISLVLVLILIVSLVGCGKTKKRQPIKLTLSTEDSEAILKAAGITLPDAEVAPGANSVVKYFGWGNPYENYSEDEIVNTGYWTFQEKYSSRIEFIETTYFEASNDLATLILGSSPPDTMTGGWSFPLHAIRGTVQAIDEWIDFTDPLWAPVKELADKFSINGKHYQICIETAPSNVVVYNRRVINEFGFDDPADLYRNDEWTWNAFYNMCMDFSDPDEDRFALDGYAFEGMFVESSGKQYLMTDENGRYYSNLDAPEIERGQNYIYDLVKNDCCYGRGGWALRGDFGAGMKEGLCLFYVIGESFFTRPVEEVESLWGAISEGEVMFAPLPRDEQGDGIYYMPSSFIDIKGSLVIISKAENPEGAALLAACLRFKCIDPVVIRIDEKQLQEVYLWSDEMIEMSAECQRLADEHFIMGSANNIPSNLQSVCDRLGRGIIRGGSNPSTWAQLKEANAESLNYYIDELNQLIEDFDND